MHDTLARLDAIAQADLVRRREVSPLELTEAAIARIVRVNPQLNAVIHPRFDAARAEARAVVPGSAPLAGVPFLVKDFLCLTEGDPIHLGTRVLRDAGMRAPHDSYLTQKLRAAGLVILGRTNTPELGTLPTTEPDAYGPTRNPWNLGHSTGGSSGGSAAAVAAGLVAAAHANDGGGSIRIPASECGLVGLKPSRGRTSFGPEMGDGIGGLVCEGVVTRSVRDTAALLDAMAGRMPGDPYSAPPPKRAVPRRGGRRAGSAADRRSHGAAGRHGHVRSRGGARRPAYGRAARVARAPRGRHLARRPRRPGGRAPLLHHVRHQRRLHARHARHAHRSHRHRRRRRSAQLDARRARARVLGAAAARSR